VIAGAGAGKTRTLIARAAYAVERVGIAPQAILAIAFTNKACGEIAARLRALLDGRGGGIEVRTFHAAAWRMVVRPHAERLGRFAEASILNHSDSVRLARQAIVELAVESVISASQAEGRGFETRRPLRRSHKHVLLLVARSGSALIDHETPACRLTQARRCRQPRRSRPLNASVV
jgi:superfamily I DNA/RNA helicase